MGVVTVMTGGENLGAKHMQTSAQSGVLGEMPPEPHKHTPRAAAWAQHPYSSPTPALPYQTPNCALPCAPRTLPTSATARSHVCPYPAPVTNRAAPHLSLLCICSIRETGEPGKQRLNF